MCQLSCRFRFIDSPMHFNTHWSNQASFRSVFFIISFSLWASRIETNIRNSLVMPLTGFMSQKKKESHKMTSLIVRCREIIPHKFMVFIDEVKRRQWSFLQLYFHCFEFNTFSLRYLSGWLSAYHSLCTCWHKKMDLISSLTNNFLFITQFSQQNTLFYENETHRNLFLFRLVFVT